MVSLAYSPFDALMIVDIETAPIERSAFEQMARAVELPQLMRIFRVWWARQHSDLVVEAVPSEAAVLRKQW